MASNKDRKLLTGYVTGPNIVTDSGTEGKRYQYEMRPTKDSSRVLNLDWQNIWWIAGYDEKADDMKEGASGDPGDKSIWMDADVAANGDSFLSGDILAGHNLATNEAAMERYHAEAAAGPDKTSYPGCICPH